ncbi:MAG: SMC-Scp complex subunit ScpB [Clostridia bacterium]|nr:SMC-Scp complex subunit ScpB [Clostridia bacterium]
MNKNYKEIIKATLFVAGEGIELSAFMEKLEISEKTIKKIVEELKKDFYEENGIHLIEYKNKIQLCSNPNYADEISNILNPIREKALTKAALETAAIIAYKQPITKLEIEEIRDVNSADYAVQVLLQHKLIEVVGRKDAVGKPLLFGTTDEFLKRFSLKDISELPDYEDLMERIKLIRQENVDEQLANDGLYREYEVKQDEDMPEFLKDEPNVEQVEASKVDLDRVDQILKQTLTIKINNDTQEG